MKKRFNPQVFDLKTVFMQRIADYVRLGYRHYVLGEVPAGRAQALVDKLNRRYQVGQDRNQRARAKASGDGCAILLLYAPPTTSGKDAGVPTTRLHTPAIHWALLVTPGAHPAHTLERLKDAWQRDQRLPLTGYELVQLSRKDSARASWTWRMTGDTYEAWRERVIDIARKRTCSEHVLFADLYAAPGFSGIRSQVGRIVGLFRREWKRHRSEAFPKLPHLFYAQRLPNRGTPLNRLAKSE